MKKRIRKKGQVVELKTETSNHRCMLCDKTANTLPEVVVWSASSSYHGSIAERLIHWECWINQNLSGLIHCDEIRPKYKEKWKAKLLLEEL